MNTAPATAPKAAPTAPTARYGLPAIALHWILGLAILAVFALGVYMHELPVSPQRLKLFVWHKWAGGTILLLSIVRLAWRWTHRPPALSAAMQAAMPAWQRAAHHGVHHLMYALFFIVPLAGWAYSSAAGFPVVLFGVLPLPDFVPVSEDIAALAKRLHGLSAWALLGLVVLHVGAALKHHFIDRDGLLDRMRPSRG